MSITLNELRVGNFTSSEAYRLCGYDRAGKNPSEDFYTYIEEKNMERELGMSLGLETEARPLQWGKHCEQFAFEHTEMKYTLTSDVTMVHPKYDFWVGSPDGHSEDAVFDLKCPMTRKSFFKMVAGNGIFDMVDGFTRNGAEYKKHTDGKKYLMQLISNAIITGKSYCELLVYMPYQKDLSAIKEAAKDVYNWIYYAADIELPHIHEGGPFKDITTIRFEVPQREADFLTERMELASTYLIPLKTATLTIHDSVNGINLTVTEQA